MARKAKYQHSMANLQQALLKYRLTWRDIQELEQSNRKINLLPLPSPWTVQRERKLLRRRPRELARRPRSRKPSCLGKISTNKLQAKVPWKRQLKYIKSVAKEEFELVNEKEQVLCSEQRQKNLHTLGTHTKMTNDAGAKHSQIWECTANWDCSKFSQFSVHHVRLCLPALSFIYFFGFIWLAGKHMEALMANAVTGFTTYAASPTLLPTASSTSTHCLIGDYYNGENFDTYVFSNIENKIEFHWWYGSPSSAVNVDSFSARWTGYIKPSYSEQYTFSADSDNVVSLYIGGTAVINSFNNNIYTRTGTISLTANTMYSFVLNYMEHNETAHMKLYWSSNSQTSQIVPNSAFYCNYIAISSGSVATTNGATNCLIGSYYNGANFDTFLYSQNRKQRHPVPVE